MVLPKKQFLRKQIQQKSSQPTNDLALNHIENKRKPIHVSRNVQNYITIINWP